MPVKLISPSEAAAMRTARRGVAVIDVRSPGEFAAVHAAGAVNLPLERVSPQSVRSIAGAGDDDVLLICKSGGRAGKACQQLIDAGMTNIASVQGGTDAWIAAGLEVVRGKGVISIERQVRIAAGLLVLIGVLLGAFVSVYFLIISGFVGAGLMFAGITDWCGMGLLLARMPWNQLARSGA